LGCRDRGISIEKLKTALFRATHLLWKDILYEQALMKWQHMIFFQCFYLMINAEHM
jgi:hypothetical protein